MATQRKLNIIVHEVDHHGACGSEMAARNASNTSHALKLPAKYRYAAPIAMLDRVG